MASGFWDSLFGGSSSNLNTLIGQYGQAGASELGQGQKNQNQAGNFFSSILSGDSSKVSQALSPQISAAKTSAQQQNATNAQFGTRSGGTAASTAATSDKVHSDITNLIGSLTNSSASNLASLGSTQVGQGSGLLSQEQGAVEQRMQNWSNSLFGQAIGFGTGKAFGYGLNSIFGQKTPNQNNQNNGNGSPLNDGGYATTQGQVPTGFFNDQGDYVGGMAAS
jgi:hypothetical protein